MYKSVNFCNLIMNKYASMSKKFIFGQNLHEICGCHGNNKWYKYNYLTKFLRRIKEQLVKVSIQFLGVKGFKNLMGRCMASSRYTSEEWTGLQHWSNPNKGIFNYNILLVIIILFYWQHHCMRQACLQPTWHISSYLLRRHERSCFYLKSS